MLGQLLDNAFGGSASGLVMALMESRRISPAEARRIRELIDGMQENGK
jgi:predicted transcriptional regulator